MNRNRYDVILAVFPNTRGFAYVVFEGPLSPVDWGISDVRGPEQNRQCVGRIEKLIDLHAPSALVLRDEAHGARRGRTERITDLVEAIEDTAQAHGVVVAKFSRSQVQRSFEFLGSPTRMAIVTTIAKHIPLFARYVPPARKIWKSEDRRMGLFDAAALALSFYRHNPAS